MPATKKKKKQSSFKAALCIWMPRQSHILIMLPAGRGPAGEQEHPSSYQLAVTDTACLVSLPVGVCSLFPGYNV